MPCAVPIAFCVAFDTGASTPSTDQLLQTDVSHSWPMARTTAEFVTGHSTANRPSPRCARGADRPLTSYHPTAQV